MTKEAPAPILPKPPCPECGSLSLRLVWPTEGASPDGMRGDYACDFCAWAGYHFPPATLPEATVKKLHAESQRMAEEREAGRLYFLRVNYSCFGDRCGHDGLEDKLWDLFDDEALIDRRSGNHYLYLELRKPPSPGQIGQIHSLPGVTRIELR